MKKLVLSAFAAISLFAANGQDITLFGQDGSGAYGTPYAFGSSAAFAPATISGEAVYQLTGVGTLGNGIPASGSGYLPIPYAGTAANFIFSLDLTWSGTSALQLDFKTTTSTSNFRALSVALPSSSSSSFVTITVPSSAFLSGYGYGAPLSDGDISNLTEFQLTPIGATANTIVNITNIKIIDKSVVTSYTNNSIAEKFVVSPNPSNVGSVNVTTSFNLYGITVVNSQGVQVNASVNGNVVNTAGLTPGVYTLLITTDNGTAAKKVVIE